ncbi:MAG: hypothetical protein ACFE8B_02085 [Candidatus Hermodarchaeota archaeon]
MPREIKGLILSRLIILLTIVLLPVAIFLIYNLADFSLWFSSDTTLEVGLIKLLCPIVFCVSWVFFLVLFAERFSDTLDEIDRTISVVPSRLKFFYGVNAVYILFIFVFPFITPIISVISFASFAWRLTTFQKKRWEEDTKISTLTWIMMIIFAILPIFCSIIVLPEYLILLDFLWNDIWLPILPYLYIISYSLFTALAIGSLIILFKTSGVAEYEQLFSEPSAKQKFWNVRILEILLFGFFLFLDLFNFEVIHLFYILGFIIIIFISIVNFLRGKTKIKSFKSHLLGYFIAAVFIGSNVLFTTSEISQILRVWSLVISAVMYIFVFFYTFLRLD